MRCLSYFLLACLFLFAASSIHATIIHVPGDQPTIQAGIDACTDGDTVLVADGIYTGDGNRDIDFTGKAIVVMSENGPEVTIINCEGSYSDPHRGFYFHSGEDLSSVVQGFTITNGYSTSGSGMRNASSSSPTVTNCIFSENSASLDGSGMYNYWNSSPTVTNCTFRQNSASQNGGGMCNYLSSPTVTNCTFSGNSAGTYGSGMLNYQSNSTITNCTFSGNTAIWQGGGMYNYQSNPTIINCTFSQNSVYSQNGNGGGMHNNQSNPTVTNCTFSGNSADNGGGMYNLDSSSPKVTNCILWGDLPDEIYDGDSPTVTYSDVEGGYPGEGNIDADPLFISFHGFDYLLNRGSSCIDAGDPIIEDGRAWPAWYNNGLRSDMGAYGGPGNVEWIQ